MAITAFDPIYNWLRWAHFVIATVFFFLLLRIGPFLGKLLKLLQRCLPVVATPESGRVVSTQDLIGIYRHPIVLAIFSVCFQVGETIFVKIRGVFQFVFVGCLFLERMK